MSTSVKYVKIELNRAAINRIKQRTKAELQAWARDVLNRRVKPVTPIDTGELRRSADVSVDDSGNVTWFWTALHAPTVEDAWGGRFSPKAPGTIAPFAEPTIREAVQEEIHRPIGKGFTL